MVLVCACGHSLLELELTLKRTVFSAAQMRSALAESKIVVRGTIDHARSIHPRTPRVSEKANKWRKREGPNKQFAYSQFPLRGHIGCIRCGSFSWVTETPSAPKSPFCSHALLIRKRVRVKIPLHGPCYSRF